MIYVEIHGSAMDSKVVYPVLVLIHFDEMIASD